jgi:hypothetical protein
MINLSQLDIPDYTSRRHRDAALLATTARPHLQALKLLPPGEHSSELSLLMRLVLEEVIDLLQDDTCTEEHEFRSEIDRIVNNVLPRDDDESMKLVHDLGCHHDPLSLLTVDSWSMVLRVALEQRVMNIVMALVQFYCAGLDEWVSLRQQNDLWAVREQLCDEIAKELPDVLSARARVTADEAAVWITVHVVGPPVNVALSLLKDGRNLEEAVEVAKTFKSDH